MNSNDGGFSDVLFIKVFAFLCVLREKKLYNVMCFFKYIFECMYERCYSGLGEELLKQFCTLVMQKALFLRLIFIII